MGFIEPRLRSSTPSVLCAQALGGQRTGPVRIFEKVLALGSLVNRVDGSLLGRHRPLNRCAERRSVPSSSISGSGDTPINQAAYADVTPYPVEWVGSNAGRGTYAQ